MSGNESVFKLIEDVMAQRIDASGARGVRQSAYDILKVGTERGYAMSTRDIYMILRKLKVSGSRGPVNRAVQTLIEDGLVVYVGKEIRTGIQPTMVPTYKAVIDDA